MSITASSTLDAVFAASATKWGPSSTDIDAWNTAKPADADTKTVTNIGLFGGDLTTFIADCATATTNCKSADYELYNGWGVGISWTKGTTDQATGDFDAVLFTSTSDLIEVEWDTATNTLTAFGMASAYTPAATYTTTNSGTAVVDGTEDPFEAWYGVAAKINTEQ